MDRGQQETERILKSIEKRINHEYATAMREIEDELSVYFAKFEKKDETWRRWVASGERTKEEYQQWRIGQMAVGRRWADQKESIAKQLVETSKTSLGFVRKYSPEIYAENFNYSTYQVEHMAGINTPFTLYSKVSVNNLVEKNPDIAPPVGKKLAAEIAEGKAIKWNKQQVQSVMIQGILQGDSIPKLATRLATKVSDKNRKASIRNARTLATGVQNVGRVDSYKRAQDMGVDLEQMWMATMDNRTRHSHRWLDGEVRPVGEAFSNGCEYPADPKGDPAEIYNCRCSLRGVVKGLQPKARQYRDTSTVGGMSYDEWRNAKAKSQKITNPDEAARLAKQGYLDEYRGNTNGLNKNGEQIKYNWNISDKITGDRRERAIARNERTEELINQLSGEYNSYLTSVYSGTGKTHAAGYVDLVGEMHLSSTKQDTVLHEFAHSLASSDRVKMNMADDNEKAFMKELSKLYSNYNTDCDKNPLISISAYSSVNKDEFFAEAFAHAKAKQLGLGTPLGYGSDYTYSNKVLELTDKYFKKATYPTANIKSGIIKSTENEYQRYGRNKDTVINHTYIESGAYRKKFDNITDKPNVNRVIYQQSKEMLNHRSGTNFEDMCWIDASTGKIVAREIDQKVEKKIIYSEATKNAIRDTDNLVAVHTHPASMPPSIADFNSDFKHGYNTSLILGHDGTVYQYTAKEEVPEKLHELYVKKYVDKGYPEKQAQLKALDSIKKSYSIDYKEIE